MIQTPLDVLGEFPVRKTRKQKQAFRAAVQSYAEGVGYSVAVESGRWGSRNLVIGNPETAHYLITAHYDTPAGMWVPNVMIPCHLLWFLLSQILLTLGLLLPAIGAAVAVACWMPGTGYWYPVFVGMGWLLVILLMVGVANRKNANDNTSGVVTVLETAASMPENLRDRVCFVLFDLEELGLIGSAAYRKAHPQSRHQIVLNLDCVGNGDTLMLFPTKALGKDPQEMAWLSMVERPCGQKIIRIRKKGFALYPSDQLRFPKGVGICALRKNRLYYYINSIHTFRDTILDYTNVNILRACLISYIGSHTAQ